MRVVGRNIIEAFCLRHADGRRWIENWLADAESAAWKTPSDIKSSYASASFLPSDVVIFNVKGNSYRLEAIVEYRAGIIEVIWVGTHATYDARNRRRRN